MKKVYTFLAVAAIAGFTVISAQQLPNNDFEGTWSAAKPYSSISVNVTIGENPENWTISHVTGVAKGLGFLVPVGTGKKALGSKVAGYNSNSAVELKNASTGAMNITRNVPGYLTTGTSWSTAVSVNNTDGGTFGSIPFTYRPDAVSAMYKRAHGTENQENATVVAYLWKGTWTQANVPAAIVISGTPNQINMEDRDRCVLGISLDGCQGGEVTKTDDAELIGKVIYTIEGDQADWKELEVPIEYLSDATPEKFNIIFSSNDYFTTTVGLDNTLTVDDVKLVYYSRLSSLKYDGVDVEGFDPEVYNYDLSAIEMPDDASKVAFTNMGNSGVAKTTATVDADNNRILLTVNNAHGSDKDGKNEHVYTLQFASKSNDDPVDLENATVFEGTLVIEMMGGQINEGDQTKYKIYLTPNTKGTYDLLLPNFQLELDPENGPQSLGDIRVDNVTCTDEADGSHKYAGEAKDMKLLGGAIVADVNVDGTETAMGILAMKIGVMWKMDETNELPIDVTFNGARILSGVEAVNIDRAEAPVEYYDLQGRRLANPTNGIVIRRQGSKVEKVIL